MQVCNRCFGSKEVWGIGGMHVACPPCGGTGKIATPLKVADIIDKLDTPVKKTRKKQAEVK